MVFLAQSGGVYDTVRGRSYAVRVVIEGLDGGTRLPAWVWEYRAFAEALEEAGYHGVYDDPGDGVAGDPDYDWVPDEAGGPDYDWVPDEAGGPDYDWVPDEELMAAEASAAEEEEGEESRPSEQLDRTRYEVIEWVRRPDGPVLRLWDTSEGHAREVQLHLSLSDLHRSGIHLESLDELLSMLLHMQGIELDDELYDTVRTSFEAFLRAQGVRIFSD
ncbi:MAG: hypothetical protein ACTSYL_02850 [Candidatus Thorarchaeota archaeon]